MAFIPALSSSCKGINFLNKNSDLNLIGSFPSLVMKIKKRLVQVESCSENKK
jgi:hypothetical protein